jgi:hypothetical protein
MYLDDAIAPEYYGQATQDGAYDDVQTYGQGSAPDVSVSVNNAAHLAWLLVVVALAGLWVMGAGFFKGSNHS